MTITEPGVVYDMTDEAYHRDPVEAGSLSSSGARDLLPPSCPALYRFKADNGEEHKRAFDLGHAAHTLNLGTGKPLVKVVGSGKDPESWNTNATKDEVQAVRDAGSVPLHPSDYETVHAMAAALRADRTCAALFNPEHGQAEVSGFWVDAEFDVWRRFRTDWLNQRPGRRLLVVDYKTTDSVDPRAIQKAVHSHGYYMQQPFYLDGVEALGLAEDPAFLFVFQMKKPPYLVQIVTLKPSAVELGRDRNRAALERFRDCQKTGIWPGPTAEPLEIDLPRYASYQWADEQDMTDD